MLTVTSEACSFLIHYHVEHTVNSCSIHLILVMSFRKHTVWKHSHPTGTLKFCKTVISLRQGFTSQSHRPCTYIKKFYLKLTCNVYVSTKFIFNSLSSETTNSKTAGAAVLEKLRISQLAENNKNVIDLEAHYSNHLSPGVLISP